MTKPTHCNCICGCTKEVYEVYYQELDSDIDTVLCAECQAEADQDNELPEPSHDDSVKFCPNCEQPNQFGQLCAECERDEQDAINAGERWAEAHEGNG
jgi:predicted amidophosphoribosyltransferase